MDIFTTDARDYKNNNDGLISMNTVHNARIHTYTLNTHKNNEIQAHSTSRSPSTMANCSTFSNWCTLKMPQVSLPCLPASLRKHVEMPI